MAEVRGFSRSRRTVVACLFGAAVAALGVFIVNPPAAHAVGPPSIVALGDSYISGEAGRWQGNGNTVYPGSRYGTDRAAYDCNTAETWCYHDPRLVYGASYINECDRSVTSEVTYARAVAIGGVTYPIGSADRYNVACSGATSSAIYQAPFKGEPPQVQQLAAIAGETTVKAVVLSIGGNDIGFSTIVTACVTAFVTGSSEHCSAQYNSQIPALMQTLTNAATASIHAIRTTMTGAGYHPASYRLVLQSYPAPIPTWQHNRYPGTGWTRLTEGGCPFYDDDSNWAVNVLLPAVDTALRNVANATGAQYLDMQQALAGHEVCATGVGQSTDGNTLHNRRHMAASEWVRWVGIPGAGQGDKREFLHPNYFGQRHLGGCLDAMMGQAANAYQC